MFWTTSAIGSAIDDISAAAGGRQHGKNVACAEEQGTGQERPQKIRGEVSHGVRRAREGVRREL